jgi:hypothetical protein
MPQKLFLTVIDSTGIQPYIFGVNRLRENIGASYLVAQATEDWVHNAIKSIQGLRYNLDSAGRPKDDFNIERQTSPRVCEAIFTGGGNALLLFGEIADAQAVVRTVTREALINAPGLRLATAIVDFDWRAEALAAAEARARKQLETQKRSPQGVDPLRGLGMTVPCDSTGLPAVGVTTLGNGNETLVLSAESLAKLRVAQHADVKLRTLFRASIEHYEWPQDFDELGRSRNDDSHIAVIHADGNGVGKRFERIARLCEDELKADKRTEISIEQKRADANRSHVTRLRALSRYSADLAFAILSDALATITRRITTKKDADGNERRSIVGANGAAITLRQRSDGAFLLPVRPIVYGGDDVTIVCDGRIGLSLAAELLDNCESNARSILHSCFSSDEAARNALDENPFTLCAGVAIVRTHYPFSQAYRLSEDLAGQAKAQREREADPQLAEGGDPAASYMDWHISLSGVLDSAGALRRREYQCPSGMLTLRPVAVGKKLGNRREWDVIERGITEFQTGGWADQRSKSKALRQALRDGPDSVERFRRKFLNGSLLPDIDANVQWRESGWSGENEKLARCAYFDALELMDLHISLVEEPHA